MPTIQTRKFKTGHEVFDELTDLNLGSSVLVLDETHFESLRFLNALLKDAHLFAVQSPEVEFETHKLDLRERVLNDLNILIGKFRRSIKGRIIIHHYLPNLLVKEEENRILAMLEDWMTRTREKSLVELYTLPQGTFPNFERKLQSLCDGAIIIKIKKRAETYQSVFTLAGICKPEFHFLEYPYTFEDGKLLIKWRERFTDRVPREDKSQIDERKNFLRRNLHSLQIIKGRTSPQFKNPIDYLVYTQIIERKIHFLQLLFPEAFEEILEKIARWNILDYIKLKKVDRPKIKPMKKHISIKTKLALSIPTKISSKLLRPGVHHIVPVDVYQAVREASVAFSSVIISALREPVKIKMSELEKFYQEMGARITAVESIQRVGEDPRNKLNLKYIPKIISIALLSGFDTASITEKEGKNVFKIRIKDCPMCKGVKRTEMVCQGLTGTLVGACSVTFKEKFSCREIKCKAVGDDECVFILRKVS